MNFLKKFLFLHLTIGVILVAGLVAACYYYAVDRMAIYHQAVLSSVLVSHDHLFEMAKLTLVEWEKDILLHQTTPAQACGSDILQLVNNHSLYTVSSVVNPDGQIVCADGQATELIDVSHRAYIQTAISQQRLAVGEYQIGRISNQQSVNLAYPVVVDGQVRMVLILGLSLDWINQHVNSSVLLQDIRVLITDRHATIIAGQLGQNQGVGSKVTDVDVFSTILARKQGSMIDKQINGSEMIFTYAPFFASDQNDEPETFIILGTEKNTILIEVWRIGALLLAALLTLSIVEFIAIKRHMMKTHFGNTATH
jgi:hypothetical protein